jgi:hypothetical protein
MATSHTPEEFARRIEERSRAVRKNAEKAVKRAALVADQVVVTKTPVDTGRARTNWFASIGSPLFKVVEPPESFATAEESGAFLDSPMSQARAIIASYKLGSGDIYITNSVHYIRLLDKGSSAQAPTGMTASAIAAARRHLRSVRLLRL